ncbi:lipase family protein [Mycobacterium sp. MAA66]|uniref:lipase family protein n=1 Tax=Mycobacterium sp. MAA66 TaxID=3156297 RepID=UPI003511087D
MVDSAPFDSPSEALTHAGGTATRIVYRSTSGIDGGPRLVRGSVFVPPGNSPDGGWPIITYGHGINGVANGCGPSLFPDLLGYDLVVASLLKLGFVVALSDYEGLGETGQYPLLEPKTAAYNLIDIVRAARQVVPAASDEWLAFGVSEGGHAAWAANEWASTYGDGLHFLGSAALSPTTNLSGLARLASSGWLSHDEQATLPMTLAGLRVTHPDINLNDYLHGPLAINPAMWQACAGPDVAQRLQVASTLDRYASEPSSDAAADRLTHALNDLAVPQRPASGPMLVITGDNDTIVRPQWVRTAVHDACRFGDKVQFIVRPGEGHDNLKGGDDAGVWLLDRLADKPAPNNC